MKKRMWLLLFLIVLAALDGIGMDRLRLNAAASASTDDKDGTDSSAQNRQTEAACNDGVPPEEVSAVIREELKFFPIPNCN